MIFFVLFFGEVCGLRAAPRGMPAISGRYPFRASAPHYYSFQKVLSYAVHGHHLSNQCCHLQHSNCLIIYFPATVNGFPQFYLFCLFPSIASLFSTLRRVFSYSCAYITYGMRIYISSSLYSCYGFDAIFKSEIFSNVALIHGKNESLDVIEFLNCAYDECKYAIVVTCDRERVTVSHAGFPRNTEWNGFRENEGRLPSNSRLNDRLFMPASNFLEQ